VDKNKEMVVEKFLEQKIIQPLNEEEFDIAFESIDAYVKSIIKKSISLNYLFLKNKVCQYTSKKKTEIDLEELNIIELQQTKRGVVVFLSREFSSPSQLIGLLLIPRILGISTFVIGNYNKWPINILVTLELLGVTNVYNVVEDKLSNTNLTIDPSWSFFCLGTAYVPLNDHVKHLSSPKYGLVINSDNVTSYINKEHIQIAHPSLYITEISYDNFKKSYTEDKIKGIDIIYTDCKIDITTPSFPRLLLGRGLETLWFFPQVDINDFLVEHYTILTNKQHKNSLLCF